MRANPPPQKLPDDLEDDLRDIRGLFSYLEDTQFQQYQMWKRSGAGDDFFDEANERLDAIEVRLDAIELRLDAIEDRLDAVELRLDVVEADIVDLFALAQVDRQNIADLISDNGKLRARANRSDREFKKIYQLLAGLE